MDRTAPAGAAAPDDGRPDGHAGEHVRAVGARDHAAAEPFAGVSVTEAPGSPGSPASRMPSPSVSENTVPTTVPHPWYPTGAASASAATPTVSVWAAFPVVSVESDGVVTRTVADHGHAGQREVAVGAGRRGA